MTARETLLIAGLFLLVACSSGSGGDAEASWQLSPAELPPAGGTVHIVLQAEASAAGVTHGGSTTPLTPGDDGGWQVDLALPANSQDDNQVVSHVLTLHYSDADGSSHSTERTITVLPLEGPPELPAP